jgi:hypothetical protein
VQLREFEPLTFCIPCTRHAPQFRRPESHYVWFLQVRMHVVSGGVALQVTAEASEMVTVPRAELDALRAEVRRLRREVGRSVARARMEADPGPGAYGGGPRPGRRLGNPVAQ